ncbi:SH2 domain-containing adapter protein E-like [Neosynchiropus ocellatus]
MAKWFKEFPITLKNGPDRSRSDPGFQSKTSGLKSAHRKNGSADSTGAAGVGSLLKNRKNSASESVRNGSTPKDGKVWDNLFARKNSRADAVFEEQNPRAKSSGSAYINRLIRVDQQDRSPNFNCDTGRDSDAEKNVQVKTEKVTILEDYADPFDATRTRERREAERAAENDGYMEPYDAQQMITEIRRRGSKDLLKVVMEGDDVSMEGGPPPPTKLHEIHNEGSRDQSLEVDRRPSVECKKEQVIKTLSAPLDSPERTVKEERPHHTLTRAPHLHLRQKSWTQRILKPSTSNPRMDAEVSCVDPTLPLERQSWYHGCVTRQEAESQLQSRREASFLVRNSESDSSKYSIALKTSQGCVHIIVAQTRENTFTLDQSSCVFPSIPEVVHHYCSEQLPFHGAEHMTLLHPVSRV